ncbi:hypothetical protein [Pseudalkalibacillus salsuginis]|uniref:hypothetical protein n=1 Tax=Pseudalkalibacillus salsuginis TaxID=2910972 RepID=UPI001F30D5F3|nr:hypothetical protein [Pseudalkalibacillus salsuginis]MCF6412069.1 hypothetical protein [Pseudalkalibacillus salsuginis]
MEQVGFYWVSLIFWLLIGVALLLFVWGLWKKSWIALLTSGIALLLPSLYFGGAENWFRLLVLLPLIPFALAYKHKKTKQV